MNLLQWVRAVAGSSCRKPAKVGPHEIISALLALVWSSLAFADNCGSLSDCYGTISAASAVAAAIAAGMAALAVLYPGILGASEAHAAVPSAPNTFISPEEAAKIIAAAKAWGEAKVPYVMGGKTAEGADCSGSTQGIFNDAGHGYPYQPTSSFGNLVPEYFDQSPDNIPQAGDVGLYPGHIVIYDPGAGPNGKDVWSASHPGGKPYGAGKSTWYGKGQPPVWYRRKKP